MVIAVTGGGSGAISSLLEVPGASASVLEAIVPYAATALADWLGGTPDHYCSERTARAMAMAAFERAANFPTPIRTRFSASGQQPVSPAIDPNAALIEFMSPGNRRTKQP